MKYSSGLISSIWNGGIEVNTFSDYFTYSSKGTSGKIAYVDVTSTKLFLGAVWGTLVFIYDGRHYQIKGLKNALCEQLQKEIQSKTKSVIKKFLTGHSEKFDEVTKELNKLSRKPIYISQQDIRNWASKASTIGKYISHSLFESKLLPESLQSKLGVFAYFDADNDALAQRNERYVKWAITKYDSLFGKLEKYSLSEEQRRAIVINEDRNLLIAAAGAGKTSTLVGKAVFLIESQQANPEDILILSFNKDAQLEIESRLNSLTNVVESIQVAPQARTFHAFGQELITKAEGKKPAIAEDIGKSGNNAILTRLIGQLIEREVDFASKWFDFVTAYMRPLITAHEFSNYSEYNTYIRQEADGVRKAREEYGEDWDSSIFTTLAGHQVKSLEEQRICDWLTKNGVNYEYERKYEINTADKEHRQYFPDFYYPEAKLYHEHFALNSAGRAPSFMTDYEDGVTWKRKLHLENNTKLIETTSAQISEDSIFEKLEKALLENGVSFSPMSNEQIDKLLKDKNSTQTYIGLFTTFLRHYKSNDGSLESIRERARDQKDKGRCQRFVVLFETIYNKYQAFLNEQQQIDFEDQINKACEYLESKKVKHGYKYILVDEFQDISQDRKRLILAMLAEDPYIKLFAVGDDWQSIYRFSGADIDIMTNFPKHFGATSQNYLTNTFRSYQAIVDVASTFIQKNPKQIRKEISSQSDLKGKQLVRIVDCQDSNHQMLELKNILNKLDELANKKNTTLSVFLLGRYRSLQPNNLDELNRQYIHLEIDFKTIHASKGLEADYVILLNLNGGRRGFPSGIVDDPILYLIIPDPETYPDAEERRLMYVALTRAKRCVYLMTQQDWRSKFVNELASHPKVYAPATLNIQTLCPNCHQGTLKFRKSKSGFEFYGCSRYPACKTIVNKDEYRARFKGN